MMPWRIGLVAALVAGVSGCATHTAPASAAPRYPAFEQPGVPASLITPAAVADLQQRAWALLQSGDLGAASNAFANALKRMPAFYPAKAGLGYVALAGQQFAPAVAQFEAALAGDDTYLPALAGLADAKLAAKDDAGAIAALERVVAVDPSREDARSRLEVLRVRGVEAQMTAGQRARAGGNLVEAHAAFERALAMAPASSPILRELAGVETAAGAFDAAEAHARSAIGIDGSDAESHAALGEVLAAEGRDRDAAASFARANEIEPRPVWRDRAAALTGRADIAALPAEFRAIPTAVSVTRAQVAAYLVSTLKDLVNHAPAHSASVITDIRGHWAATAILAVTSAGLMDVLPNHTFQPAMPVNRADLARVASQVLSVLAPLRPADAAKWRAARPRFDDVPSDHAAYGAVAVAVAAGVMTADGGHFVPARLVTGEELVATVSRLGRLARQSQ
jgi:tetratricopeptide (TPR) repeat protein